MDEIWVLQCRRTGETYATLFFYSNEEEAFREEENKKEDFDFVGLESWTTNYPLKPKTKVHKGANPRTDFFCPRCLHLLGSHSNYCPDCGKKLQWKQT